MEYINIIRANNLALIDKLTSSVNIILKSKMAQRYSEIRIEHTRAIENYSDSDNDEDDTAAIDTEDSDSEVESEELDTEIDDVQSNSESGEEEGVESDAWIYVGKDGTEWNSTPFNARRVRAHNVIRGATHKVV